LGYSCRMACVEGPSYVYGTIRAYRARYMYMQNGGIKSYCEQSRGTDDVYYGVICVEGVVGF
jgi:hypothetical protein